MNIIAFSGRKQSGKTTAANYIGRMFQAEQDINFASVLKMIVLNLFVPAEWGWTEWDIETNKDIMLPLGKTLRETLQWFGTDVCRKAYPDCWVNAYKKQIEPCDEFWKPDVTITADVRFPNEVACIQKLGGIVIRFTRCPFPEDKHESETALDFMLAPVGKRPVDMLYEEGHEYFSTQFNYVIDNTNMTLDEKNEAVAKILKERGLV